MTSKGLDKASTLLKQAFICFAIIYLTAYACIAVMAYSPWWYKASCEIHPRCEKFGMPDAHNHIDELAAYLRHDGKLYSTFWSSKERRHLAEVRELYKVMALLFIFTLLLSLTLLKNQPRLFLHRASKINVVLIIALLALTPWFTPFWKLIHPYFFDNMDWLNTPREVSYWITPRYHFQYSAILLGSILVLTHIALFFTTRKPRS